MTTPIGQSLAKPPYKLAVAISVGLIAVAGDLIFVGQHLWYERGLLPLIAVIAFVQLADGDLSSLGLRVLPIQGWPYWLRATIWLAVAMGVFATAWVWILMSGEYDLPVITTPPSTAGQRFWDMCIYAPVLEESIYRFALCIPIVALVRPWVAILASGLAFSLLHFVSGNPSPENAIGGFLLAWCFLKSGSIYLPLILHSLGNSVVLASQVGGWYLLQSR